MGKQRILIPVRIASGVALSDEVNVGQHRLVGIIMPAVWTTANLTFAVLISQPAGEPPVPVYGAALDGSGNEVTITSPVQAAYISLASTLPLRALGRFKLRSGTLGVPVNQAAQRDFSLVVVED